jgi:hypothetical protein
MLCTPTSDGGLCLPASEAVATPISCDAPRLLVGPTTGPAADPGCRLQAVVSALPPGDIQELGTFSPGTQVSFNVPAGAVGFSIVSQTVDFETTFISCQGVTVANVPVPTPVFTPTGASFFDVTANVPRDQTTASLLSYGYYSPPYTAALTFPNTTAGLRIALDGGLPSGQWTFDVNDYAHAFVGPEGCLAETPPNTYDVSVVVAPGPLPPTGQLAVDIYLVTDELDAGSAVNSAGVQQFASQYASILASAGLCVTTITFHDVPAWALAKYSSVSLDDSNDPCSDYRQLFTLAGSARSMALFFVDDILFSGGPSGGIILGVDGAIPGNATYNGTIAGGALVLSADFSANGCTPQYCGPDVVAHTAAHETGHFLGLLHPTELTGDSFDPLTDTASCVCSVCETNPGIAAACGNNPDGGQATVIDSSVCSGATQLCGGANLLMFWSFTPEAAITPQEGAVMRANPLISAP